MGINYRFERAVEKSNLIKINKLIEEGENIKATDYDGETILFTAVETHYHHNGHRLERSNCKEVISTLVKAGADVNQANEGGKTPISMAVELGNEEAVEALVKGGATVKGIQTFKLTTSLQDGTLLLRAVEKNNPKIVRILVDAGADVNEADKERKFTPLLMALLIGNKEVIKILEGAGAKYDKYCELVSASQKSKLGKEEVNNFSKKEKLLNVAAKSNNLRAVKALVQAGAKVNEADGDSSYRENRYTPLYIAVSKRTSLYCYF